MFFNEEDKEISNNDSNNTDESSFTTKQWNNYIYCALGSIIALQHKKNLSHKIVSNFSPAQIN